MPVTALAVPKEDKIVNLMFMSVQHAETEAYVDIYTCNDSFYPLGEPVKVNLKGSEIDYHKALRTEAIEKGHYRPEFSTNREWDPGYVEYDETESN
jgi:hypothetical protein